MKALLRSPAPATGAETPGRGGRDDPTTRSITELLLDWSSGDPLALEALIPLILQDLRATARRLMSRERPDHTLQPTALVHELFIHLGSRESVDWRNRAQFFGFAAGAMRRILVDHARHRMRKKRGSGAPIASLDEATLVSTTAAGHKRWPDAELLALHEALERLELLSPRQSRVVELRFFAGLTVEEVADLMETSPATVYRDWAVAKAWLFHQLRPRGTP